MTDKNQYDRQIGDYQMKPISLEVSAVIISACTLSLLAFAGIVAYLWGLK